MPPPSEKLWVELVGTMIVARVRGTPTVELIQECQARIVSLLQDTSCQRVMYDALEMQAPHLDVALEQQNLTQALKEPSLRLAIVVPNTRVAYLARLAFGDANHRVFYNDIAAAMRWLEEPAWPTSRT